MSVWSGVTIDCLDPGCIAPFWSTLLGREPGPPARWSGLPRTKGVIPSQLDIKKAMAADRARRSTGIGYPVSRRCERPHARSCDEHERYAEGARLDQFRQRQNG